MKKIDLKNMRRATMGNKKGRTPPKTIYSLTINTGDPQLFHFSTGRSFSTSLDFKSPSKICSLYKITLNWRFWGEIDPRTFSFLFLLPWSMNTRENISQYNVFDRHIISCLGVFQSMKIQGICEYLSRKNISK